MRSVNECYSGESIDDYLSGHMEARQAAGLESHLSVCPNCQSRLEKQSAEPEIWENARLLLGQATCSAMNLASNTTESHEQSRFDMLDLLSPTDDPAMLGRIGEYEVSGVVGIGGMGAVLRGFDKALRRVVAIKVMAPHLAGSGPARTRFQREARAAAGITHDNVIDIYGVSEANGVPFLVMPFARGPSLQKRIDQSGPLSAIEVVRIGRQIALGLAAAHEQGLVHRDIKPANILLNEGVERLWITDFGVARAMDDASMTKTGQIAGTPQYMSPEQARGESVDHRSDLFSLGSILYTACTGRPPFRSETAYGVLHRITESEPSPIREISPDIPDWLCRVIKRLMAKQPTNRFESAGEVAQILEQCLAHLQQPEKIELPEKVTQDPNFDLQSHPGMTPRGSRRWRVWRWTLVATCLLLLICFAVFQFSTPRETAESSTGANTRSAGIASPINGTIVRWGPGIHENAVVKRGNLIAEIRDDTPERMLQLSEQKELAQRQLNLAKQTYDTSKQLLTSALNRVEARKAQVQSLATSSERITQAANSEIASFEAKLEAAKAAQAAQRAVVSQFETEFARYKDEYRQEFISEIKLRECERKLKKAIAKLEQASSTVNECEIALAAQAEYFAVKERKAEAELQEVTALALEAEMSLINIQLQVATSESKWLDAQQSADDARTHLERVSTVRVSAPSDGTLQQFTHMLNVREGDIICIIQPHTGDSHSERHPAEPSQAANYDADTWPAPIPRWPPAREFDDALRLASRLRDLQTRLNAMVTDSNDRDAELREQLSQELAVAQQDRDAVVAILQTKLSTRQDLYDQQSRIVDQLKLRFDNGLGSKHEWMEAEESALRTKGELIKLELLIEFFGHIHARDQQSDRAAILELLRLRLSNNQKRAAIQQAIVKRVKAAVETGTIDPSDLADAERTLSQIKSHSSQLELLMKHVGQEDSENTRSTEHPSSERTQQAETPAQ